MKNKKSSLTLSINAIVVMILAITLLGLGLGFIKKQFSSATNQFDTVNQETATTMIKDLESSGDMVTMSMREFNIESGKPMEFYLAVRNTGSAPAEYYLQFICDQSLGHDSCRPGSTYGTQENMYSTSNQMNWFNTFNSITISPGRGKAIVVKLQASGDTETYKGRLIVWRCQRQTDDVPCRATHIQFDQAGAVAPTQVTQQAANGITALATVRYTLKVI